MNAPPLNSKAGFTLTETIIALAIIITVAALSFAALSRLRSPATSIACLNQMRQIGVGIHLYLAEHRYIVFEQGARDTPNNWISKTAPYLSADKRLYKCPADKTPERVERTYRFNNTPGASGPANTGSLFGKPYRSIPSPGSTILLFCVAYKGPAAMPLFKVDTECWSHTFDRQIAFRPIYPRLHDPKAVNVLFADGHAGTLADPVEDNLYYWDRP